MDLQDIGDKLSEIGSRLDYPRLTKDLAQEIETLWEDAAIQVSRLHPLIAFPYSLYVVNFCHQLLG